jgi:hypothetical protein
MWNLSSWMCSSVWPCHCAEFFYPWRMCRSRHRLRCRNALLTFQFQLLGCVKQQSVSQLSNHHKRRRKGPTKRAVELHTARPWTDNFENFNALRFTSHQWNTGGQLKNSHTQKIHWELEQRHCFIWTQCGSFPHKSQLGKSPCVCFPWHSREKDFSHWRRTEKAIKSSD